MSRARILRARQRERAFTTYHDAHRAMCRIHVKFCSRMADLWHTDALGRDMPSDDSQRLRRLWNQNWDAFDLAMRPRCARANCWDLALGALLRCCELAREAGRLRAEVRR